MILHENIILKFSARLASLYCTKLILVYDMLASVVVLKNIGIRISSSDHELLLWNTCWDKNILLKNFVEN